MRHHTQPRRDRHHDLKTRSIRSTGPPWTGPIPAKPGAVACARLTSETGDAGYTRLLSIQISGRKYNESHGRPSLRTPGGPALPSPHAGTADTSGRPLLDSRQPSSTEVPMRWIGRAVL